MRSSSGAWAPYQPEVTAMKRTGSTKKSTRQLIVGLERLSRHTKQRIWADIAERLGRPARNMAKVNLWKLDSMRQSCKGKILVVPGKVLGTGEITGPVEVAAFSFSASAAKKIGTAKGKAVGMRQLMEGKPKPSAMVIVE